MASGFLVAGCLILMIKACLSSMEESRLMTDLLTGYNRMSRPVLRDDDTVHAKLNVSLRDVINLDEDTGQLSVRIWLKMTWKDEYMVWYPMEYGGVQRLHLSIEDLWVPDITLYNSLGSGFSQVRETKHKSYGGRTRCTSTCLFAEREDDKKLVVFHDGVVTWVLPTTNSVICPHEFRTNAWICVFRYGSWVYPLHQLDINAFTSVVDVDDADFPPNDHWSVLSHQGTREVGPADNEPYVSMEYMIKFRNKIGPSLLGRRK